MRMKEDSITVRTWPIGSFQYRSLPRSTGVRGMRQHEFWFGRTAVFSAGFFIPTSLATVARIAFYYA